MKWYKKLALAAIGIPTVLAVAVAFGTAPMGRRYVNAHGEELIGRRVNIEDFRLNILTGNISLSDATIYEKNGTDVFASVDDLTLGVSVIDLLRGRLHVEDLTVKHPVVHVVQRGQQFNFDDLVDSLSEGESSEYTIDDLLLKNGTVHYLDLTEPSVPFEYQIDKLKIKSENFKTSDLNHILLSADLGEDGELEAIYDGRIDNRDNMALELHLRDVDLTALSPLFVQMFGRTVESGQLNLDTEITVQNGALRGTNHLVLLDPKVQKQKDLPFKPEYRRLPLKTALYIMTDKDGRCETDLPVSGSLTDPKFSYKRAVMRMFGKCLLKMVSSPFHRHHVDEDDE